ncbi:uncharacterized protein LOC120112049 isoform X2 [Phoenix dactylifera]|uniref:Uncharacterized protein LOC120112049 isoform X2 n=1 Tax=Phoenix dactylifera TaxID=42345 RepID=A0A8B9ALL5_PHODC|nr:uncharacterized protein LOC120112049 isoform X2 [Phoenix dactylifera]
MVWQHFQGTFNTNFMSEEEQKIREELENDIERDLEEEIKDGICRLALRLHRLYQHKEDRNRPRSSTNNARPQSDLKNEVHMEMNITIKMDGGCKIEIFENKPNTLHMVRPSSCRSKAKQGRTQCSTKQFDWSRTLRSGMSSVIAIGKNHGNQYVRNHNKPLKLVWKY